jgi:glycosyltransferase involved in cell wall biosynthesis
MLAVLTTHPIQYQVPLWQALSEAGTVPFEVWYLTNHGTQPSYDQQFGKTFAWDINTLEGYPYRLLRVNKNPSVNSFSRLRLAESLHKLFQERGVKALWVNGWQAAAYWQAVWQAHAARISIWMRGESNDLSPPPPVWKRFAKRSMLRQLFSRTSHFLYIGNANRRLYEKFGVRDEQLHPSPYCVDNQRFALQASSLRSLRQSLRRAWNIPEGAFCILFAGKFIPKKRPLDIIAAARDQRLKGRPVHLLFAGSGELGGVLRQACNLTFDIESSTPRQPQAVSFDAHAPHASFVGFLNQTEISKAYVAADCLALPSDHRETWGLVVNEAMASGLPCIASDACGCSEDLIAPINPSFCFPLGDAGALAEAVLSLMAQPNLGSALQAQVTKFSINASVETVKQLYHSTA